jgi:hypothetical protein
MKKKWLLVLGVLLLIFGLVFIGLSSVWIETPKVEIKRAVDWSVTGDFYKNDRIFVEIKANPQWGEILGEDEYDMGINVSIAASSGGYVIFRAYYHVFPATSGSGMPPTLSPLNATLVGSSGNPPLSVENVQDYLGGIVSRDDNFTVTVDQLSIYYNFLSNKPPNPIILLRSEIHYPYECFFLPGAVFAVAGVCCVAIWVFIRRRKVRKRFKETSA